MSPRAPSLADLSLTQLSYVVAVDTHRHFGQAAAACNVTQPTLSTQLGKLERALGVVLFDRSRSPVVPTDVGRRVVEQARVTLREAARVISIPGLAAGQVAGELRLGVIPTLAPYLLPQLLPELSRRFPLLELVIEERLTEEILEGLRRETLDAALLASSMASPEVSERLLFIEPFVGYVSATHRLAGRTSIRPADLSLDDLWLLAEGHCFREQTVRLCRQRATRRGPAARPNCTNGARFESGNLETLKRLVENGAGMTLLPALAAADLRTDSQRALLRPFAGTPPTREIRLVRRRTSLKEYLVDAVIETLLAGLPKDLRTPEPKKGRGRVGK
jgi:LysR family transcriptional regulator, hydrogen peroxide-inducible genes activator